MMLGEILRERRKLNNLTLKQLSANCGISLVHLSNIENGKKDPKYSTLDAIAESYNLSVADMLREPVSRMTDIELMGVDRRGWAGDEAMEHSAVEEQEWLSRFGYAIPPTQGKVAVIQRILDRLDKLDKLVAEQKKSLAEMKGQYNKVFGKHRLRQMSEADRVLGKETG